ncbi:MAG: hypothetical protein L0387_34585 [Acidobacteria bacterium]|nr:hypothetical protein [Acidobacteriota bacterium]
MICVVCGRRIEEGRRHGQPPREAKYCLKCRADRRRQATLKYTWRSEYDAYLNAHYFGGLNHRFRVLTRIVCMSGLPRWYIKRQAARLGLTMHIDRRPWTAAEKRLLESMIGLVSTATIAKRLQRPESSVVNKLKRSGTSRRVRDGYTMRDLEQCLGEDHRKISTWIANGWLKDRLQGTRRHGGNGNDIHRIREQDILNFLKNHPQEINLGKVDQTWFLDLVLLKGREVPEAKSRRREEAEGRDAAA